MKKILLFMLTIVLIFAITYPSAAAADKKNDLSLEVSYNLPYNSESADGSFAVGLLHPVWKYFRVMGDAQFSLLKNEANTQPPGITAGVGISIPLKSFRFIVDLKKGFELKSGGINSYCDIQDIGIDRKLNSKFTFRCYYRSLTNFDNSYTVKDDKLNYLGLGFDYKL